VWWGSLPAAAANVGGGQVCIKWGGITNRKEEISHTLSPALPATARLSGTKGSASETKAGRTVYRARSQHLPPGGVCKAGELMF
jgi:hypothetical protein